MLYYTQIKSWFLASTEKGLKFFRPESSHAVQRLQLFWLACGALVIVVLAYGISTFLFGGPSLPQQESETKVTTTPIETATKKINLDEAFRNGIEDKLKTLSDDLIALKTLFQEGAKRGDFPSEGLNNEGDNQSFSSLSSQSTLAQDLEAKILNLEQQLEMQRMGQPSPQPFLPQGSQEEQQKKPHSESLFEPYRKSQK